MLEGAELTKQFDGGAGSLVVDVTDKGEVSVSASYNKDLEGFANVKTTLELQSNIFIIAEKIAAKTAATWDDAAVVGLKKLLGIAQ